MKYTVINQNYTIKAKISSYSHPELKVGINKRKKVISLMYIHLNPAFMLGFRGKKTTMGL